MDSIEGLLAASPNAILVADEAGRITAANGHAESLVGSEAADLTGKGLADVLDCPDGDAGDVLPDLPPAEGPERVGREADLAARTDDGSRIPVEVVVDAVEVDGEARTVASITDVSELKRRERELQNRNERLDQFASVVSHDLRNPLTILRSSLDLAAETGEAEHIERCERAVDRMDSLVDDLLTIARHGDAPVETEPVSVEGVARDAWEAVSTPEATLSEAEPGTIDADEERLRVLLENLLRNAVEHGGPDVTVTVGATGEGFFVADDGPGIPPEERADVFESGYSTADEGTGFGLSIVREIADAHGWEVGVAESESGGARFEVFPA